MLVLRNPSLTSLCRIATFGTWSNPIELKRLYERFHHVPTEIIFNQESRIVSYYLYVYYFHFRTYLNLLHWLFSNVQIPLKWIYPNSVCHLTLINCIKCITMWRKGPCYSFEHAHFMSCIFSIIGCYMYL